MSLRDFALQMIAKSPQVANSPQAQEMIQVIQNNDSVKGQQIAENLCNTYGMSKEEAANKAKQFFGM